MVSPVLRLCLSVSALIATFVGRRVMSVGSPMVVRKCRVRNSPRSTPAYSWADASPVSRLSKYSPALKTRRWAPRSPAERSRYVGRLWKVAGAARSATTSEYRSYRVPSGRSGRTSLAMFGVPVRP